MIKLLLIEDNPPDARVIREMLKTAPPGAFEVKHVIRLDQALQAIQQNQPDVALMDLGLPDSQGLASLTAVLAAHPDLPIVVLTGLNDQTFAVEAVRAGAQDYLVKGRINGEVLVRTLQYALERHRSRRELALGEAAQRALAETQISILNALPAHIALLNVDGVIVAVNESWRRFASANVLQSKDFFAGQNYLAVCDAAHGSCAEEAQAAAKGIRQILTGEQRFFSLEYPCHSPTEKRWFRLMATPLSERPGSGAVVMHVNVTERRLAEDALREREIAQRQLAEKLTIETQRLHESQMVANIGSWETDRATLEITWTEETYRIFEVSPAEFRPTHQKFMELVHPDDRAKLDAAFTDSQARAEAVVLEHRICLPGGRVKFVEERWQVFKDEAGRPARAVGTCQDITERKRADLALQASESRLRTIFDNEPECVKIVSVDGILLDMNPAGLRMIEAPDGKNVIGKPVIGLIHPEDRATFMELHTRVTCDETGHAQFRITGLQGTERWMESHSTPLRSADGAINSVLSVTRDITERRRAEQKDAEQLAELRRWQAAMLDRTDRNMELKREVNALLVRLGEPIRYSSQPPAPPQS